METDQKLPLEIISPEGYLFQGNCHMAVIPATEGEMGIMKNHELVLTSLKKGSVKIYDQSNHILQEFPVNSGFAKMMKTKLLVLIDE